MRFQTVISSQKYTDRFVFTIYPPSFRVLFRGHLLENHRVLWLRKKSMREGVMAQATPHQPCDEVKGKIQKLIIIPNERGFQDQNIRNHTTEENNGPFSFLCLQQVSMPSWIALQGLLWWWRKGLSKITITHLIVQYYPLNHSGGDGLSSLFPVIIILCPGTQ